MKDVRKRMLMADLGMLGAALLWGTGFVAMKAAVEGIPPFFLVGTRFLLSALCLSPFLFFRPWKKKDLQGGLVVGLFLFLGFFFQTTGLQYTTSSKQAFFTATYVVITPFLVWGLRRIFPGIRVFLAAGLCFCGVALLSFGGSLLGGMNVGDWLSLIGAIFFAGHLIAIEHYAPRQDVILLVFFQVFVAGIVSICCAGIFESWPETVPLSSWAGLAYTVVFGTLIAFLLQNWGQKYTSSSHAALLLGLESLFGALAGVMLLHEAFTLPMIFGGLLILAGVFVCELGPVMVPARKANSRS
ncbi:MAG TPA: DMT family transporter [Synergistaceae bacterium]|nr:DMT family transporter [Synergistaceae bacterium]HPJ26304.1 DMT family transporter [Synergistaceae bacterium]HPQ36488.1 DMT family transporter [Synergistaceae bacterium]